MSVTYVDSPSQSTGPQQASVNELQIITASGQPVDIKKLLVEFSYFEDIYSFVLSGYVTLRDAYGVVEKLQLTGKEYIRVNFGISKDSTSNVDKTFWLYTIPEKIPTGSGSQEIIKLHFTSVEMLLSESTKITNSYKGKKIDYIVADICADKLKISPKDIHITPTMGLYPFSVPVLKPFEAISWVSNYARPSGGIGADMLFFENRDGYNFKSIRKMIDSEPYKTYKYQQKNLSDETFEEKLNSVLEYKFTKTFNSLKDASSGAFANRVITINPLNKTIKVNDFDYNKYRSAAGISGASALTPSTNRLGLKPNETYTGKLKMFVGNSELKKRDYVSAGVDTIAEDIFMEDCVKHRTAQLSLVSRIVAKLKVPGDPGVRVGQTIIFDLPSVSVSNNNDKQSDKYYSGKYLVTAVRHIIQSQGAFQTILEISRESPESNFAPENSNSSEIKAAENE